MKATLLVNKSSEDQFLFKISVKVTKAIFLSPLLCVDLSALAIVGFNFKVQRRMDPETPCTLTQLKCNKNVHAITSGNSSQILL